MSETTLKAPVLKTSRFRVYFSRFAAGCALVAGLTVFGGAAFLALTPSTCGRSNWRTTRQGAETMRSAVIMFRAENPRQCPSVDDLMEGDYLDRTRRLTDAWDKDFQILCSGRNVHVHSAGPDGEFWSDDDGPDDPYGGRAVYAEAYLAQMRGLREQLARERGMTLGQLENELRRD